MQPRGPLAGCMVGSTTPPRVAASGRPEGPSPRAATTLTRISRDVLTESPTSDLPSYFEEPPPVPLSVLGRWAAIATLVSAAALVVVGLGAQPLLDAFAGGGLLSR